MTREKKPRYHIRDLATDRTGEFTDYRAMIKWAEIQTRTVYRTDGGWRSIGQPGIMVKFWDSHSPMGGAINHRFIIHRFEP